MKTTGRILGTIWPWQRKTLLSQGGIAFLGLKPQILNQSSSHFWITTTCSQLFSFRHYGWNALVILIFLSLERWAGCDEKLVGSWYRTGMLAIYLFYQGRYFLFKNIFRSGDHIVFFLQNVNVFIYDEWQGIWMWCLIISPLSTHNFKLACSLSVKIRLIKRWSNYKMFNTAVNAAMLIHDH